MGVHDLNFSWFICDDSEFERLGVKHERGQDAVRTGHGVCAMEDFWSHHRTARGDAGIRTLGCADLFRIMAFAQLTWRESLRDIEVCLTANQVKLFHMGLKGSPARSTLADALNSRDWAHLPRPGATAYSSRQIAVRQ